jgi:elongator complex protein 1
MKNIAISGTWRFTLPGSNITTAIVDVDRACLWIASERLNADADVEIDVYKRGFSDNSYEMDSEDVSAPFQVPVPWPGLARRYRFTTTPGSTAH